MNLKYTDEEDKCYGITGMAISMVVWDADDMLAAVSLDAEPAEAVEFMPEFYYSGNPRVSAKASWSNIFKHFQTSMGMMIGNVMCRSYLLHSAAPAADLRKTLLRLVDEEGRDTCSLESDEIERVFNRSYDYLDKVFHHHGVQMLAHQFADTLRRQRRMSRSEVMECLEALSRL